MTEQKPLRERPIAQREAPRLAAPDLDPLLARIYSARGVRQPSETSLSLKNLLPPTDMLGLSEAVELLCEAVQVEDARILVVGDFDADGATATALAVLVLRAMGAENVGYFVPNRFEFGYGLTPKAVDIAAELQPDIILTVDNGISSVEGVTRAQELGMSVIVTDHHLPGETLPTAEAIVNPNQPGCRFPSKHLCGVGVMFYVLSALRARLRSEGWFESAGIEIPNLAEYLDLVALGTVADVVPLDHNNRILVAEGLRRIAAGRCRPGITALLEAGNRNPASVTSTDLGFAVGPRLNAAGRLEDMSVGIECLMADNTRAARPLAEQLDAMNQTRREIEGEMQAEAELAVKSISEQSVEGLPRGLCLYNDGWHHGIVGLVAARIRERFDRPTVALAPAHDDEVKGSGRSVPGLHMRDLFENIARQHPDLIDRFGGHAMAAGLSLKPENVEAFTAAFEQAVLDEMGSDYAPGTLLTDGQLSREYLDLGFAQRLRDAGPWGQAFDEPLFEGEFDVQNPQIVGTDHVKLALRDAESGRVHQGIAFRFADRIEAIENASRLRVVYRLEVNEFRGERKPQLVITHMQPC